MGDEPQKLAPFLPENVEQMLNLAKKFEGPLKRHFAKKQADFRGDIESGNNAKIDSGDPELVAQALSKTQIDNLVKAKLAEYAEELREPLTKAASGEAGATNDIGRIIKDATQLGGQVQQTQSAFANFNILNPLSWLQLPAALMSLFSNSLIGDYTSAALRAFGDKSEENKSKGFMEKFKLHLAEVKAEKGLDAVATKLAVDGGALKDYLRTPQQAATISAPTAHADAAEGMIVPPPQQTPGRIAQQGAINAPAIV